jgi:rhodanese-related sulfurtransferase
VAATWDKSVPLVLYCRSGGRSDRCAMDLERDGFKRVGSLKGGVLLWAQLGLPIDGELQG